jgi:uncharacterized protein with von Willebrand factor type A (vWA) domain
MNPTDPHTMQFARPSEGSFTAAVISFARVLKAHRFTISVPSVMDALSGLSRVGIERVDDVRTVLKATFINRIEEEETFDRLFDAFWMAELSMPSGFGEQAGEGLPLDDAAMAGAHEILPDAAPSVSQGDEGNDQPKTLTEPAGRSEEIPQAGAFGDAIMPVAEPQWASPPESIVPVEPSPGFAVYSPVEVLREQDFRYIPDREAPLMARQIREMLAPIIRHQGVRRQAAVSGSWVDFRRTFRKNVLYGGEILVIPRMKPKRRLKKLVFLCDVSGSMNPYLRFMLRFIKEIQQLPTKVETFVFATRLTRITPYLERLPFPRALKEISHTVRDWSGGTRIGACLHEFVSVYGSAMLRPSTLVLIHSDGWDRGDTDSLEREMTRIHRRAYRVLWINPLLGGPSYEPICRGMKTALPHVDAFLPGRNLAGFERVSGALKDLL